MLKIPYHGWKLEVTDNQATASKDGEQLEIRKTGDFERGLRLIKNAVDRRLGKPTPVQAGAKEE